MNLRICGLLLLLISIAGAEFILTSVDVTIRDIKPDGTAKVTENIKIMLVGEQAQNDYDAGFSSNDISFWSSTTKLQDVRYHVNPAKVSIKELRVLPQPRKKCNPLQGVCHGELIIQYEIEPLYNDTNGSKTIVRDSGLFFVTKSKPRTTTYRLNPEALSFITTPQGNVLLPENVRLTIELPSNSVVTDLNPTPENVKIDLPAKLKTISWTDTILVKLSVVFEVEETLEGEVKDFFYNVYLSFYNILTGEHGWALIAIIVIIVSGYVYITIEKKGREV
ncbi:MAG: hypothetical protein QXS88_02555 [Candidatus Bilamarchaeaceae archaeon]